MIRPYAALLDFLSAMTFVIIPVAWFPLIILFGILAFIHWISDLFKDDQYAKAGYEGKDYDKEVCLIFQRLD